MKGEFLFTRHSKAKYETYGETLKSENPQASHNPDNQLENDLSESGIELARKKAEKLFDSMDSQKDALFFVSSKEARAFETAMIYQEVAKERGFEIIETRDEDSRDMKNGMTRKMADENIRAINSLSLKISNQLVGNIFNPEAYLGEINWQALDEETKKKWKMAREIINADDQGSWGGNFYKHSGSIQKIFPELKSSRDEYETTFRKLLRLVQFAQSKVESSDGKKNIKILAFGHENYLGHALNEYFGDHEIKNCETLTIEADIDGGYKMERKNY
ncbi:MAG: hypothetical protein ACD_11C00103G0007 [uncultured bacterium]|nr:MAG: hypothetical protein ACD_11C00103G0007 [uncultured bacterium]HBR71912.1 hypothetical protein [Candidatus Moranbacteria bacterium]